MTPNTDIVLPIRSTRRYPIEPILQKCYDTLCATTKNFRLIMVDDNSDAEGAALIDQLAKQRRDTLLIRTNFQHWFTRAVNLGLRFARTDWTVVINSDVEFGAGWLEELYAVREEAEATTHQKIGLVGSQVFEPAEPRRWADSKNPDYVTGHCWLLSIPAVFEASAARGTPGLYLDETQQRNIHIRSDVEICWDLNKLGWGTIKAFKSEVGHHGGKSWGFNLGEALSVQIPQVSYNYQ